MPAPISVVVPTLDAGMFLHHMLYSLMEGVEAGLIHEVIVSDAGSKDRTVEIAKDWGARIIVGEASRGGQLRRGCAQARGEWLLVLHADTVLSQGWAAAVRQHLDCSEAGWFSLRFDQGGIMGRWVSLWANWRSLLGLPYGDQGMLVSRQLYESVGGYADIALMEDVALARALKGRLRRIDACAITSAEKYRRSGWLRRGGRNLLTLIRYFLGTSPETLAQSYRRP